MPPVHGASLFGAQRADRQMKNLLVNAMPGRSRPAATDNLDPRDKDTSGTVDVHADENRGVAASSIWPLEAR